MLQQLLSQQFDLDLKKLRAEIEAYTDETLLWKTAEGISNSGGNLCLHLIGNLNHFIGAELGNTGYVRHRDKEFSDNDIQKDKLLAEIERVRDIVVNTVKGLTTDDLEKPATFQKEGRVMKNDAFLLHLSAHLSYHIGQINYHRRMIR